MRKIDPCGLPRNGNLAVVMLNDGLANGQPGERTRPYVWRAPRKDQGGQRIKGPTLVVATRQSRCTSVPRGRELQFSTGSIGKKT